MKSFREKWEFLLSQIIEIITLRSPGGSGPILHPREALCYFWVWNLQTSYCHLKASDGGRTAGSCCTAGSKACGAPWAPREQGALGEN